MHCLLNMPSLCVVKSISPCEFVPSVEDIQNIIHTFGRKCGFIIRLTHANVWESMGKPCSCMQFIKSRIFYCKSRENPYQYYKSHENPYQVLQVTHTASERAMKSKVRMIKSFSP